MTMDFKGQTLSYDEDVEFTLRNTEDSCRKLCGLIRKTLEDNGLGSERMLACNVDLTGRVNTASGYSFTYFINEDKPLSAILEEDLGVPVALDNDSRAMTYGEFRSGIANGERSVLFINVGWGLGHGNDPERRPVLWQVRFFRRVRTFPVSGQRTDLPLRKDRLSGDRSLRLGSPTDSDGETGGGMPVYAG